MNLKEIPVIPHPKNIIREDKIVCVQCCITTEHENWKPLLRVFADSFEKINGVPIEYGSGGIELILDNSKKSGEYAFDANDGIRLYASDYEGAAHALATALSLVHAKDGYIVSDAFKIEDYFDKDFRGFMLDLARCWHPFETILKFVDLCFLYKVKYLHLHFVDDEAYRLPSKAFPLLAETGKSYTFEEINRLNRYAQDRGIVIIPEVESPGHVSILNKKYPHIFSNSYDTSPQSSIVSEVGVVISHENVLCPGSEVSVNAFKTLVSEVCEMFPLSPYLHIGGDEVNIQAWEECVACRKYMQSNNIKNVQALYADFTARICKYVISLGKTPIVWEGFSKEYASLIPKETIVIAWESHYNMPYDLLNDGFKIINASWQPLYILNSLKLRWNPFDILNWNVYNWQHWWPESEAYLNPINVNPTDMVWGGMLCSWVLTYEQEVNFVMENLAALSERTWNTRRVCSNDEYRIKYKKLMVIAGKLIA